jgi:hypothetical protein
LEGSPKWLGGSPHLTGEFSTRLWNIAFYSSTLTWKFLHIDLEVSPH